MSDAADWKARPGGADYEATRQRLVDVAETIVSTNGVSALRLDAVAEGAGLHRSSVYRYFDSKEDLITAVVAQATRRLGQLVRDRLGPSATPAELLSDGLALALSEMAVDPIYRSLLDPDASGLIARVGGRVLIEGLGPLAEPMFDAASRAGLLRPGVSPADALRWLHVVATGLLRSPEVVPDRPELSGFLARMLVPSIFQPEPAPGAAS